MAIDTTARDNLITALGSGTCNQATFDAWVESLVDLNQINSEVLHELNDVHGTGNL